MGAGNVKAVYAQWRQLPHAPFRLLAYMAVVSLDSPDGNIPARLFFAGREAMAVALGSMPPPENPDDPAVVRERRAAFGRVDRALKELVEKGAVERVKQAGHFSNAHYALNILRGARTTVSVNQGSDHGEREPSGEADGSRTTVSVDLQDHGEREPKDHGERGCRTTVSVTTDHGQRGAEEYEEPQGLTGGGTGPGSPHPAARTHASVDEAGEPEPESLRLVTTDGIRDPLPAGGGAPGQRAMLLPVADPQGASAPLTAPPAPAPAQDDSEDLYGPCVNPDCGRGILRSRRMCPHCFAEQQPRMQTGAS